MTIKRKVDLLFLLLLGSSLAGVCALTAFLAIKIVDEKILIVLGSFAAFSVILFGAGLFFARRYITRSIQQLQALTDQIHRGRFGPEGPLASADEIGKLAALFNEKLEDLNRSIEQYQILLDNASDLVFMTDLDGRFQRANQAVERILGYSREELATMRLDDVVTPESATVQRDILEVMLSDEQPVAVYEIDLLTKRGQRVTLEISSRLITENGKPVAIHGIGRDVTERKNLQEQLRVAQKTEAVGRFAGSIAHDFGNVLTIINGYCAIILGRLPADDPLRGQVEGIQREGERAASLIHHLLGFSAKGQIFRPVALKLHPAINAMQDMLQRLVGEDVRLIINIGPDTGFARFDPTHLQQVLVNLALNARDSMPRGGELQIETANVEITPANGGGADQLSPGRYVSIVMRDTGSGMPRSVLDKIFEPFFSTKEHRTGLGLSTVRDVVRQFGGNVIVDSSVDVGTTVTILLPEADPGTATITVVPPGPATQITNGTETILLVEDEERVRRLLYHVLSDAGYTVLEARDQFHAMELCKQPQRNIDLMLTDVVMPGMSGPDLAESVRRMRPNLKILYMSGYTREKFEKSGIDADAVHFIQKPLSRDSLLLGVRAVLDADSMPEETSRP
jgi:two-component system cell cycle sensor histidine kinase/response regulator CckA